jgi:cobalt-zinc-cadmium efflux system membrane fusion protein
MEDGAQEQQRRPNRGWSLKTQLYAVASLAAMAGLVAFFAFFLGGGSGPAPSSPPSPAGKLATFVPTSQQLHSLGIQTVGTRPFRTQIVTDGYVAPNGGFAAVGKDSGPISHGLPVLAGQSTDVLQAESDLVTAGAQFRAAQANESRQHQLYDSQGAALKDWQQAQVDLATASAALTSARNRLRIMGKSNAAIAAFEKEIPRSQDPSAGTAFAVGDLSTVWLVANVRETDAGMVHPGDDVQVHVPAFPNEIFKAQVTYVSSVIDPASHRLVIGAEIRNAGEKLKPNMQATFTIFAGPPSNAPAVPQNALVYEGDDARVWVVDRHGDISLRSVTTGRSDGNYMEITSGLSAGEQIVTSGALFIDQAANRT